MVTGTARTIQVTVRQQRADRQPAQGAAVEVPCVVDGDGARPVAVGACRRSARRSTGSFLSVVDLTVRLPPRGARSSSGRR